MASLDVVSLFTNIPIEETASVSCDSLFSNDAKINNIDKIDFEKLLKQLYKKTFSISKKNL